jgi:phage protein D
MQRATDIHFLRQRAERNGFEFYVQPETAFGLDFAYFRPPQLSGTPSAVLNVNMGPETNVVDFRAGYEMDAATAAVSSGIDVYTKTVQQAVALTSGQVPMGLEPALLRNTSAPVVRPAGMGPMTNGELQSVTQAIADRSSFAVTAEGTVDQGVGILRPGTLVNVRGAGRLFNGTYYLARVTHTITREDYTQRFFARRNAVTMTGTELYAQI